MRVSNLPVPTTSNAKNAALIAASPKTQDFKDALRSASDIKPEQPVHGSADAKSEKKDREAMKEHTETPSVITLVPERETAKPVAQVPLLTQGGSTSTTEPAAKDEPTKPAGSIVSTQRLLTAQVKADPSDAGKLFGNKLQGEEPATSLNSSDQIAGAEPQVAGMQPSDASSDTSNTGSEKTESTVSPADVMTPATVPINVPVAFGETGDVDPMGAPRSATNTVKTADVDNPAGKVPQPTTGKTDAVLSEAVAQIPVPMQESPAPQAVGSKEPFKGSEVAEAKESVTGSAGTSKKGKTAVSGFHEKPKSEEIEAVSAVGDQAPSKVVAPQVVIDGNVAHATAGQGSELISLAPAAGVNPSSSDSSQTLAEGKAVSAGDATTPAAAPVATNLESAAVPALSSAHLVQSIRQSEMKLGMTSAEFGSISISTAVNRQTLSAQIVLDHSELSLVLSNHLSGVEERLGQAYGLHAKVEVRDSGPSSYEGSRQSSEGESKPPRGFSPTGIGTRIANAVPSSSSTLSSVSVSSRLDILI